MFGQVGMSYVYFTYGMYFMLNVVAKSRKQNAGAVLIRGIYPRDGIKIMIKNRGIKDVNKITNGPGKLTLAIDVTMKENNIDLTKKSSIYISKGITPKKIKKLPRVGISKAIDKEWNFSINPKDYLQVRRFVSHFHPRECGPNGVIRLTHVMSESYRRIASGDH